MRTLIQRVQHASVTIDGQLKSKIGKGLLVLVGIEDRDTQEDIEWLCKKIANLRIFDDENGVMNRSIVETEGEVMVVSQFTLHASTKKGNRPSYIHASKPDIAIPMYEAFCAEMGLQIGKEVQTGTFGADMKVELVNDGPVTIWIETYGVRYFNELTNMTILTEEVGELARIMARTYGEQSFKESEKHRDLGDEMADVLWVLLCLANQTGVDLTAAFEKNLQKKTNRDKERHINNKKL